MATKTWPVATRGGGASRDTVPTPPTPSQVGQGYPHDPPKVKCETMVYHPNIDLEGNVCLNILRWATATSEWPLPHPRWPLPYLGWPRLDLGPHLPLDTRQGGTRGQTFALCTLSVVTGWPQSPWGGHGHRWGGPSVPSDTRLCPQRGLEARPDDKLHHLRPAVPLPGEYRWGASPCGWGAPIVALGWPLGGSR